MRRKKAVTFLSRSLQKNGPHSVMQGDFPLVALSISPWCLLCPQRLHQLPQWCCLWSAPSRLDIALVGQAESAEHWLLYKPQQTHNGMTYRLSHILQNRHALVSVFVVQCPCASPETFSRSTTLPSVQPNQSEEVLRHVYAVMHM